MELVLVFFVGLVASFIGSMVGSGGLISIPFLIFIGLPPHVAIATSKLGAMGLFAGAITGYWKSNNIRWEFVIPFSIISLITAFVGAFILLSVNRAFLFRMVGIVILLILPLIFLNSKMGLKRSKVSKKKLYLGYFLYSLALIWSAFFGGGAGTIAYAIMMGLMGFTMLEASATHKIPALISTVVSFLILAFNGLVDYALGFVLMAGMLMGGFFGARFAVRKGNAWVKVLFGVLIVASAVKLIFF